MEAAAVANSVSADYAESAGDTAVAGNIATSGMHTLASFPCTVGFPGSVVRRGELENVGMYEHSEKLHKQVLAAASAACFVQLEKG